MKKCFLLLAFGFCLQLIAADFELISVSAPESYVKSACGDKFKLSETVLFVEVQAGNNIVWHSKGQSIAGHKRDYHFNEKFKINDNESNVIIKILVGEKEALERGLRAGAGAAGGAGLGALIGAIGAGVCTGGLGAPLGALIGGAVGAASGATVVQLAPIEGQREVASFSFYSLSSVRGTQSRLCGNGDIMSDGQKITISIK